jgi:hypothetical protein
MHTVTSLALMKQRDTLLVVQRHFSVSSSESFAPFVLVEWNCATNVFNVVSGVNPEKVKEGQLELCYRDDHFLCSFYQLTGSSTYKSLVEKGCSFKVKHTPTAASKGVVGTMAAEFGVKVVYIPRIRAFKLEWLDSETPALSDPYIHSIFRISDLNVAQWKAAIVDTLRREGVEIEQGLAERDKSIKFWGKHDG